MADAAPAAARERPGRPGPVAAAGVSEGARDMSDAFPQDLAYTSEHEWWRAADGAVGITHFAQQSLGDVVYVELPAVGQRVEAGRPFGTVESVKSVSDLYSPVSGTVIAVNSLLAREPEQVNRDPYGAGWMIRVQVDPGAPTVPLLRADEYRARVEGN
jgi:glycine cleavage system H protein